MRVHIQFSCVRLTHHQTWVSVNQKVLRHYIQGDDGGEDKILRVRVAIRGRVRVRVAVRVREKVGVGARVRVY